MSGKILVVDDEKHIRMLYQEELEGEGYDVVTSDGEGLGLLGPVDGESGVVEMVIGGIGVFGTVVAAGVGTSSAADAGTV